MASSRDFIILLLALLLPESSLLHSSISILLNLNSTPSRFFSVWGPVLKGQVHRSKSAPILVVPVISPLYLAISRVGKTRFNFSLAYHIFHEHLLAILGFSHSQTQIFSHCVSVCSHANVDTMQAFWLSVVWGFMRIPLQLVLL